MQFMHAVHGRVTADLGRRLTGIGPAHTDDLPDSEARCGRQDRLTAVGLDTQRAKHPVGGLRNET